MSQLLQQHLSRIRTATTSKLGRGDIARWIEQNTYINGRNFSFKDHEYQERILTDPSTELVIRKSAQTGISEMSMRMAVALVMVMPGAFRVGYTLPTATAATTYAKTRFSAIVNTSPTLRAAISSADIDSADTKTFGTGKELYFKGAATGNAAISTTLDMLIHDELSFSDMDVVGSYHSRVLHSSYKWKVKLSTPTFPGDPIDTEFMMSRRHFNMCRCHHCGHMFIPDYYAHVRIPDYFGELEEIKKEHLPHIRYQEAYLECPNCGKAPSLQPEHREWVCENPSEKHVAAGYQVSPFDAPNIVTVPSLIIASTSYGSKSKFCQFSLGKPSEDADNGLTSEDLDAAGVQIAQTPFTTHVMGIDLGLTSHFIVGNLDSEGRMGVVHMERVPLSRFRERYWALKSQYRIHVVVSDIQPYSDLIMGLSNEDANLFGASYVTRNGLELFDVRIKEDDPDHALLGVKQVHVNRNAAFDALLAEFREGKVWVAQNHDWELFKAHLQDMKRAAATLRNGEFTSLWQKSAKGNDHYHHALLYFSIACKMRGVVNTTLVGGLSPVKKFKLRENPHKNRRQ